ncbi:MAG TPA: hypothetical protein VG651_05750 [Stellaceae bacterium]|nr:hypothetical protein [Stellaceae bacterium]
MAKLRFSDRAELDLIEFGEFIAADSPVNARRFIIAGFSKRIRGSVLLARTCCPAYEASLMAAT